MRVLDLALKDLKQLLQDRRTVVFLLIMPLGFTLLFGFAFGGFSAGEEDTRLPLGFVNQDTSQYAQQFETYLNESVVVRLVIDDEATVDELKEMVADEDLAGLLVIPQGYGSGLMSGQITKPVLYISSGGMNGETVKAAINVIANRMFSMVTTARISTEAYERKAEFSDGDARLSYQESAFEAAISAWEEPPLNILITQTGQEREQESEALDYDNAFIHSSPGMILQFAIAGLMGAADIIVSERKSRSLQRLLTTAISRAQILLGHYLAMFVMIFIQILVLVIFGQIFLRLDYLNAPFATLLITVTISMCVAALGLLIGALARKHEHVVVLSLIPMFVLAGLGGAWVPLEYTSDIVQAVGHISPVAWGMDGFKNILARGQGIEAAWLPAGMLVLFAVIFFGVAVWRFRFEEH